jgi:hypothetical protein
MKVPLNFRWEWFSEPLDCPPDERFKPESMVGMMILLEGNHCFQGVEDSVLYIHRIN